MPQGRGIAVEIVRALRRAAHLVRDNWKSLVLFELFYKAGVIVAFIPLASRGFSLVLRATGYAYLTRENVDAFFAKPLMLLLALLMLFLAVTCAMIDNSAVVYILDRSAQRVRVRMGQVLRFSVRNALRAWRPGNLALVAIHLLLTPFMNIGLICGLLATISLPEFMTAAIRQNPGPCVFGAVALLALSALLTRWLYAFHYFTLEDRAFADAARHSASLNRGRRVKDFGILLLAQAAFSAGMVLVLLALMLLASGVGKLLNLAFGLHWLSSTAVWYAVVLSLGIVFALSAPVSYACASQLFYRRKLEAGEPVRRIRAPLPISNPAHMKMLKALWISVMALIGSGVLIVGYLINSGALNPPIEGIRTMEITAHRGASVLYPENTMAAFRGARELGADWVELDVQQTRDGQLVVLHDPDTRRTTGVRGKVWAMTYEQISKLDAGSSFSREFAGEPIPLLSEVAEYARDTGLRLNIELKPTGHETDFEQGVIDVVRAYDLQDRCVITSQVYGVLENVKACDEGITTVYVTSLAYGNIDRLSAADHFSIQSSSATRRLVSHIHNQGKQIYAWTVNTRSSIDRMIERNVDNIITDNIELARQRVTESRYSELLTGLVQTLEEEEPPEE